MMSMRKKRKGERLEMKTTTRAQPQRKRRRRMKAMDSKMRTRTMMPSKAIPLNRSNATQRDRASGTTEAEQKKEWEYIHVPLYSFLLLF